jgi:ABC-type transport system substrate-binding protein
MKTFYVVAMVIVTLLVLSPMALLQSGTDLAVSGQVVSYNVYTSKVKSVDPATCGDTTSSSIQGNFYEGLYTYHYLKRPLQVIPQLAAEMPTISDDKLTYTIQLKKGVLYQENECFPPGPDGKRTREMVADDFVLAFKRVADFHLTTPLSLAMIEGRIAGLTEYREATKRYEAGDFSRYDKEQISGLRALDDHTLQITLAKPYPQMIYALALHVYAPIPREVLDYHLATEPGGPDGERRPVPVKQRHVEITDRAAVVGTGPYLLTEWIRGGKILLARNPLYRPDFYPSEGEPGDREKGLLRDAGKRLPFVDVRRLTFVAESNPAWMLFLTKQRDTSGIPRDVYDNVISPGKELDDRWRDEGITLIKSDYPAVFWLAFNMEDPVVGASKSLRQAMCMSYDVETYIDLMFNGRGKRAVNTIPSSFRGHAEAGPSPYARLDIDAARELADKAREELVEAGVIKPGDPLPTITLDMPGRDENARRMAEYAQNQFRRIGVELEIVLNDWPTLQKKVHNKQCQMYAMGWHSDSPDAENFLQLYYTPNIERGTNNTNYSNPQFDRLFEQASTILDEDDRIPLYVEMIHILNEDCPVLLLSEPITFALVYDWVYNYKPHPIAYGLGKYTRIDVQARKRAGGP